MSWTATDNVSSRARDVLEELANSCQSESFAIADCLNDIAENGGEQATDDHLIGCAGALQESARQFVREVKDRSSELSASTKADLYDALVKICQSHGFTTQDTYDLLHDAIDSIRADGDENEPNVDDRCRSCGVDPCAEWCEGS